MDVPQSITITGNLTADPELTFGRTGVARASFTVAHSERVLDRQSGQWGDTDSQFHRCTAWREQAENIARDLHKGDRVIIHGILRQSSWTDEDGGKRYGWQVNVEDAGPSLLFHPWRVDRDG